jgi:hypothetical protein
MSPMNGSFDCRADRDGAPPLKQGSASRIDRAACPASLGSAGDKTERVEVALGADILVVVFHGVN